MLRKFSSLQSDKHTLIKPLTLLKERSSALIGEHNQLSFVKICYNVYWTQKGEEEKITDQRLVNLRL